MDVTVEHDRVRFPTPWRGWRLAAAVVLALGGAARGVEVVLRGQEVAGAAVGVVAVALGVILALRTRSGPWVDASGWHTPSRGRNQHIPWSEVTKVRVVASGDRAVWGLETDPDRGPLTRWARTDLDAVGEATAALRPWAEESGAEVVDLTHWSRGDGAPGGPDTRDGP